jgi:kynurenine formamidase
MPVSALAYEFTVLDFSANGSPRVQVRTHVVDTDRAEQPGTVLAVVVQLDATSPNQYTQQLRNAIIADAAAMARPVTLNPADVIIGAFS